MLARDIKEGVHVMINACPILVGTVQGLGRDQYIFTGYDVINGDEHIERYSARDIVTLVDVKCEDKQVVCGYNLLSRQVRNR